MHGSFLTGGGIACIGVAFLQWFGELMVPEKSEQVPAKIYLNKSTLVVRDKFCGCSYKISEH